MQTEFLNFSETASLIAAVGSRRTVIVEGENGIGKTALFYAMKDMPQFKEHLAITPIDCTQLSDGSIWMPDLDREKGVSRELPNERFNVHHANQRGINGAKPVMIAFDELAKCPQFVKNMVAPIIYERRIGQFFLPEGSVVCAFTNLAVEGLGDLIQPHLRNRLIFVKMRKPTQTEWKNNFAIPRKLHPSLIAFTENYPHVFDSFLDYEKGGRHEGKDVMKDNGMIFNPKSTQMSYASPRSLHAASDLLTEADENGLADNVVEVGLAGSVGRVCAENLSSFVRFGKDIVSYDRVIADPEKAPITDNPTAQLVQVMQFVTRADDRVQAEAVSKYVMRMRKEMQSIFCHTVAGSQRVSTFVTVGTFTQMLAEHRIFFATTK
jgi:hypothetical protein